MLFANNTTIFCLLPQFNSNKMEDNVQDWAKSLLQVKPRFKNPMLEGQKMSDEDYFSDKSATSCSQLKVLYKKGYKEFDSYMEFGQPATEALVQGTLFHTINLEHEMFDQLFAFMDEEKVHKTILDKMSPEWHAKKYKNPKVTKDYKAQLQVEIKAFGKGQQLTQLTDHIGTKNNSWNGKLLCPYEWLTMAKKMNESLYACKPAVELLSNSVHEVVFKHTVMDVNLRGKLDIVGQEFVTDLKTTSDIPTPDNARKAIYKYDYDLSMAGYSVLSGIKTQYLIFVQKSYPYTVGVYELSDDILDRGLMKLESALDMYKKWKADTGKRIPRYFQGLI